MSNTLSAPANFCHMRIQSPGFPHFKLKQKSRLLLETFRFWNVNKQFKTILSLFKTMLWAKCGLQATSCLGLVGQSGVTIVCLAPSFSGNPPPHPIYVAAVEKPHVLTWPDLWVPVDWFGDRHLTHTVFIRILTWNVLCKTEGKRPSP